MKNKPVLYLLFLLLLPAACRMPEGPVKPSADVPEAEGWSMDTILDGLEHPWSMAWLPDDSLLITERPGRLLIFPVDGAKPDTISGLPPVYADGQGGLLDVSPHPRFARNRLLYLTFSYGTEEANRTAVAKGVLHGDRLRNLEIIFKTEPVKSGNQHFGSRIAWLPDETFLLSVGDGGNRPQSIDGILSREYAQKPDAHLGKILRLDENGYPPADNPFVGDETYRPEIWSLGHRNIQGLTVAADSERIWANEHGSRGGDELNLIKPGRNYGWPEVTYSREYFGPRISRRTSKPGMEDPKMVWTPAQAPSGLAVYTGHRFPEWHGNLFSGSLAGTQVRRIITGPDGETITGEEKLSIGERVRDVKQGPDGYLYLLTDHENGRFIRIIPETP